MAYSPVLSLLNLEQCEYISCAVAIASNPATCFHTEVPASCDGTITHYRGLILFADTAKAGSVVAEALHVPVPLACAGFTAVVGGTCFAASAPQMDRINSVLVALVGLLTCGMLACILWLSSGHTCPWERQLL